MRQVPSFGADVPFRTPACVNSVALSRSGRLLFAGQTKDVVRVWDTLKGDHLHVLPHPDRVTCVGVSSDGTALCSGSWDTNLMIWA